MTSGRAPTFSKPHFYLWNRNIGNQSHWGWQKVHEIIHSNISLTHHKPSANARYDLFKLNNYFHILLISKNYKWNLSFLYSILILQKFLRFKCKNQILHTISPLLPYLCSPNKTDSLGSKLAFSSCRSGQGCLRLLICTMGIN